MSDPTLGLAIKLTSLIVPNYPFIQGTDILVSDPGACARRGTPEQRQVAREVRDTIERIWEQEAGEPVRALFERIYQPLHGSGGPPAGTRGKQHQVSTGCRLPTELLQRVLFYHHLGHVEFDEYGFDGYHHRYYKRGDDLDPELVAFAQLRLVSRDIKTLAEAAFPGARHRYINRVVRHIIHISGLGSTVRTATLATASAALFEQAEELRVYFAGDEMDALNRVLPLFINMEKLIICVTAEDTTLGGLAMDRCPKLKCLSIEGERISIWADENLPWPRTIQMQDVYVGRTVRAGVNQLDSSRDMKRDRTLDRLEIGRPPHSQYSAFASPPPFDYTTLMRAVGGSSVSLDKFREVAFYCEFSQQLVRTIYEQVSGPQILSLRNCRSPGHIIAELPHKWPADMRAVDFSRNFLQHPDSLVLLDLPRLAQLDLSYNPLASVDFDLELNTRLRYLNLSGSLRAEKLRRSDTMRWPPMAGGIEAALFDLCSQLAPNTSLEELYLDVNDLSDQEMRGWRLGDESGLRKLSLTGNKLSDKGLRAVVERCPGVEKFDLSNNPKVTDKCARELSVAVEGRVVMKERDQAVWGEFVLWREEDLNEDYLSLDALEDFSD